MAYKITQRNKMTIKFKGLNGVPMVSGGIKYIVGAEYEVTEKVGEYLTNTFGDAFEAIKAPEKPKAAPKAKPKPKAIEED